MRNLTTHLKTAAGVLMALILSPVIALFGLTVLGLAFGSALLVTAFATAVVWKEVADSEATEPTATANGHA